MKWGGGSTRGAIACAASIALVAFPRPARAQDAPEPFSIDYSAPDGCPSSTTFFAEVTARTPRARAATAGERARILHVRVEKRGEAHAGRLWIEDAGTSSTAREVSGGSCGEVVGALGLVAALAVDPRASVAPRPAPAATPATPTSTATTPPSSAADEPKPPLDKEAAKPPAKEPDKEPTPAKPEADRAASAERSSSPQQREPRRWTLGAGGEVSALSGAVVALRVFGELDLGGRLFAPSIRVAASRSLPVDRPASIGSANLTWTGGAVEASPIRLDLASTTLTLRPCAGIAVGILEAEGSGIATPRSETRAWVSANVHGRLVWAPVPAFAIELEGGAHLPILRESFFFDPNILVYQAPAIAGFGRLGAGVRFP